MYRVHCCRSVIGALRIKVFLGGQKLGLARSVSLFLMLNYRKRMKIAIAETSILFSNHFVEGVLSVLRSEILERPSSYFD